MSIKELKRLEVVQMIEKKHQNSGSLVGWKEDYLLKVLSGFPSLSN